MKNRSWLRLIGVTVAGLMTVGRANAAILYGVTGDGGSPSETLHIIDTTTAVATPFLALGAGGDGETIGFNPSDGLMYHSSGISIGQRAWESIDLNVPEVVTSTQFTGPDVSDENLAMTFDPPTGNFLVADRDDSFFSATPAGVATLIGSTPESLKGLAFVGTTLYGVAAFNSTLFELNPLDGSALSSRAITLPGFEVVGANGLATKPETGVLFAILRVEGPSGRRLVTLDPDTGVATDIGEISVSGLAGIAFQPLDHFLCYDAEGVEIDIEVDLADPFDATRVEVEEPELFCNPVDKNGEGTSYPTAHSTCYEISDREGSERHFDRDSDRHSDRDSDRHSDRDSDFEREVVIANQFGEQTLEVEEAKLLCVPSEKDGVASALDLDDFQCYAARGHSLRVSVDLEDEFGFESGVRVTRPKLFCNPVDKDGEGIRDPESHLACYAVRSGSPSDEDDDEDSDSDSGLVVSVDNPFGRQVLRVDGSELLCVPSEKLDVTEKPNVPACGVGFEAAFLLPPLAWLRRQRRGRIH